MGKASKMLRIRKRGHGQELINTQDAEHAKEKTVHLPGKALGEPCWKIPEANIAMAPWYGLGHGLAVA